MGYHNRHSCFVFDLFLRLQIRPLLSWFLYPRQPVTRNKVLIEHGDGRCRFRVVASMISVDGTNVALEAIELCNAALTSLTKLVLCN